MAAQTESPTAVVDTVPTVVPDQRRPLVTPDAASDRSTRTSPPADPRPRRRQRWLLAATAAACLTVGAVTGAVVAQRVSTGTDAAGAAKVDDRSEVLHGTTGSLIDGNGSPVSRDPLPTPPLRVEDRGESLHGTKGNLYTGDGVRVDQDRAGAPEARPSAVPARPTRADAPSAAKLAAIGWS